MTPKSNSSDALYLKILTLFVFLTFVGVLDAKNDPILVSTPDALSEAVEHAAPGELIVMKDGVWSNVELRVHGNGSSEYPIRISAQTPGAVIITGVSNLRISGSYLEVDGLVFKDGNTPTSEVISFKGAKGVYANHCRLTRCVIDNFNNPERTAQELWVVLYGRHNRVDHCYFNDKRVSGVTLAVRLIDEACQENEHSIDHNYFGYRQSLGSNGGETIRIGTSTYSMNFSYSKVVDNVFDGCSGETEIISIKSCGNLVARNLFFECQGSVVFRHGHENRVDSNWFVGNHIPDTGGVRVINQDNTVVNNYFQGLAGSGFRSPLVIMNGVPNSPLNRYMQVVRANISSNTWEDCSSLVFGGGSDSERTLVASESVFQNNLIRQSLEGPPFTILDSIDGITFSGNQYNPESLKPDFEQEAVIPNADGSPAGSALPPLPRIESLRGEGAVGIYGWQDRVTHFSTGKFIQVEPGVDTLATAVSNCHAGDVLVLRAGETYYLEKTLEIPVPLTIRSQGSGNDRPIILGSKETWFEIQNGGSLELKGLVLDASDAPDRAGNRLVTTSRYSMNRNYEFHVDDCRVVHLDSNHSFDFFYAYPSTFAGKISLKNTHFEDITGSVLALDNEKDALGLYSVEVLECSGCTFVNVQNSAMRVYRRGTDESTFGPTVKLKQCEFDHVGYGKRNESRSSVDLYGAQGVSILDCSFQKSPELHVFHTNGNPLVQFERCVFDAAGGIVCNAPNLILIDTTLPVARISTGLDEAQNG